MRRNGFVLIAALWLIVALSAVGLDAALRSQPRRVAAANQIDIARAREAALAGTEYARSRLTAALLQRNEQLRAEARSRPETRAMTQAAADRFIESYVRASMSAADYQQDPWAFPQDLMPPGMQLGDAQFLLDARDTGLRVNINEVSEDELRAFLSQGLRVDYALADNLTQAMLDWRDADDLPRINGGEAEQYLQERLPMLPPNRPFAHVDELRNVLGMTPELFQSMRPYVTVTGSGRININAAPEPVLLAIPALTPMAAAQLVRLRSAGRYARNVNELQALLGNSFQRPTGPQATLFNRRATFATNEVEIVSRGGVADSPIQTTARLVVSRGNNSAVVVWRRID